ncbi:BspA family leucine-rich repeat surface protein [Companilactobacillus sp.]|uniref:BspA family leucine-rich repeat surface protein n=1 Tax=Companilactobacillus sp. TaxID=2767905 RepID=UPI002636C013|nr:BspA family leucine-rich repeat surface protein [Companilactobacillus sp.]
MNIANKTKLTAIAGLTLSAGMILSEISETNVNAAATDSNKQELVNNTGKDFSKHINLFPNVHVPHFHIMHNPIKIHNGSSTIKVDKKKHVMTIGHGKLRHGHILQETNKVDYSKITKIIITGHVEANEDSSSLFKGFTSLKTIESINHLDVHKVHNTSHMFENDSALEQLDLTSWSTKVNNVTTMEDMFKGAAVPNLDLSNWNTHNLTTAKSMFENSRIPNLAASGWNTERVTNMNHMFKNSTVKNIDVSSWNVSNVNNMREMFADSQLDALDISSWSFNTNPNMINRDMLKNAPIQFLTVAGNTGLTDASLISGTNAGKSDIWLRQFKLANANDYYQAYSAAEIVNEIANMDQSQVATYHRIVPTTEPVCKKISLSTSDGIKTVSVTGKVGQLITIDVPLPEGLTTEQKTLDAVATQDGIIVLGTSEDTYINYTTITTTTPENPDNPEVGTNPDGQDNTGNGSDSSEKESQTDQPGSDNNAGSTTPVNPSTKPDNNTGTTKPTDNNHTINKVSKTVSTHVTKDTVTLYTSDLKVSNRSLAGGSDWLVDTVMVKDGKTYYRVSTNEWILAEDAIEYQDNRLTIKTKSDSKKKLINSLGSSSNRHLAASTSWAINRVVKIAEQNYYQVSTNEFVSVDDVEVI